MLAVLARASVDGAILAGIVWILCRAFPRLPAAARTALWWCVTARFLIVLMVSPVMLPVLTPAAPESTSTSPTAMRDTRSTVIASPSPDATGGGAVLGISGWEAIVAALWLAGVGLSSVLAMRRAHHTRRLIARATAADEALVRSAADVAARLGLKHTPVVRLSAEIASPLVSGLLHPVVLLPARFPSLPADQQQMALCHEMAHVQRGDMLLGCVPALAERLFFFHPLVRLSAREYVFWREAACDAAVIAALDAAPQSYGRLLLDLGVTGRAATLSPAGAAWSFSNLKRRILMLRRPATPTRLTRVLTIAAVALACAGLVPMQLTARPVAPDTWLTTAPAAAPLPASAMPSDEQDRELRYVLIRDEERTMMSGRSGDVERARRHRRAGESLLWLTRDGQEYVVRDAGVLADLEAIWEKVTAAGAEQAAVGAKQSGLGARQAEIGARQAALGAEQGTIGAKQAALGARQAALSAREVGRPTESERAAIERERAGLEKDMRALDAEMRALDEKMRQLDRPMRDLGDDMDVLGREMEQLGRKMEEASEKAEAETRALVDKAIRSGAAERVR
jgi:bla regulator protein BlaR1